MHPPSTLEFALAGLLRQKPQSGYDLRKTFVTTAMRHYSDSPGSIYPALRRLEARGWIAVSPEHNPPPRERRGRTAYHLTGKGIQSLVEWLSLPVHRDDVIWRLPELMLRFAFMDGNVPRSTTLGFLGEFERELAEYLAGLEANLEEMTSKFPMHTGVLAFLSGIHAMEAQLAWARQARAWLSEDAR
ncbi:MAG: PadR family transcriptional regulator [Terracidiphilus sp.]